MENEILLKAVDIHKSYKIGKNEIPVLNGIDFNVQKNEWVAILGASGSGKTTLLNILGALETPDLGSVTCGNALYSTMNSRSKAAFRCEKIGFVFQAYHMFPELSMLENVKLPAMLNRKNLPDRMTPEELLEKVGLSHRLEHKPTELSGGEQQRAAIARALINSPDMILADEPTGNLDTQTGREILEIFKELHNSELRKTIIMITHDLSVAEYADRKIFLKDGKISQT
jgi:ABC-type lipoprotein export system ATPase subunit